MQYQEIALPFVMKQPVLALGAHTKNTVCFASGRSAWISPVQKDLSNPDDFLAFNRHVKFFLRKGVKVIAYDLHPEYRSTQYKDELIPRHYKTAGVAHHHAHVAACMADNGIRNKTVIGVAFDGTGLGNDGRLWGAEFLLGSYRTFDRRGHLSEVELIGGARAVLEPYRLTCAWLARAYQDKFLSLDIPFVQGLDRRLWNALQAVRRSAVNCPTASSMGRLFDAAGSLLFARHKVMQEAELPVLLQQQALECHGQPKRYEYHVRSIGGMYSIDPVPIFDGMIHDIRAGVSTAVSAMRFHVTVADMVGTLCLRLRKESGIDTVVLSGGVFQNSLLLALCMKALCKRSFRVYAHKIVSASDAGVSLGQAAVANYNREYVCV